MAVDRVLDMFRTSLNVTSDLMVVKIVDVTTRREAVRHSHPEVDSEYTGMDSGAGPE